MNISVLWLKNMWHISLKRAADWKLRLHWFLLHIKCADINLLKQSDVQVGCEAVWKCSKIIHCWAFFPFPEMNTLKGGEEKPSILHFVEGDLEQKPSDTLRSHHHWDQISKTGQTPLCRVFSNMINVCMGAVFRPCKASADSRPQLQVQLWADLSHVNRVVHAACNQASTCAQLCLSDTLQIRILFLNSMLTRTRS